MACDDIVVRPAANDLDISAAHRLFHRRIGSTLVEDLDSFRVSAMLETPDWAPLLLLATISDVLAGAQLGGLLPGANVVSLPYTAVAVEFEGLGVYTRLKQEMLGCLRAMAASRGLAEPIGNVSEEARDSEQYRRKVGGGHAVELPIAYLQPATMGLAETDLALTFEPLVSPPPALGALDRLGLVAAVYRALYRIGDPWSIPSFQRTIASIVPADPDDERRRVPGRLSASSAIRAIQR